jgi:arylsulfatase A-like enzyme
MGRQKSIVLVTVDCLRADHVGFMGYTRRVTPFLDLLAKESVVFSDAIVAGVPTYFSFPAILASRYPLGLGRDLMGIAPNEPTIATALRDAGRATAAFLAGNPYLSPRFGYHQGFDNFQDSLDSPLPGEPAVPKLSNNNTLSRMNRGLEAFSRCTPVTAAAYNELYFWYCQWISVNRNSSFEELRRFPAADVMMDHACAWLSGIGDQPFFLWVHLMDPHNPYYPPQEALSALGQSGITARRARILNALWSRDDLRPERLQRYEEEVVSLYDAGVYWVDRQISRLVETLQKSRRWNETVVAMTADHGEEFMEHGTRYHAPMTLPEQMIHVPLLLRMEGLSGMRIADSPFSLIHLAPTLLEAVDVPVPGTFQGRSHWKQISVGTLAAEPAISELVGIEGNPMRQEDRLQPRVLAVRDIRYKLVIRFKENTDSLYDLQSDPGEHSPLPNSVSIRDRVRLLQVARTHLEKSRKDQRAELTLDARLRQIKHSVAHTDSVPA